MAYIINFSDVYVQRGFIIRRFCCMHVIVVNIKVWLMNVLVGAGADLKMLEVNCSMVTTGEIWLTIGAIAEFCTVQFCFTSASVILIMWNNVGCQTGLPRRDVNSPVGIGYTSCRESTLGLMAGGFVCVVVVFSKTLSSSLYADKKQQLVDLYYGTRIPLNIISILTVMILLKTFRTCGRTPITAAITSYKLDELVQFFCLILYAFGGMYSVISFYYYYTQKSLTEFEERVFYLNISECILIAIKLFTQTMFIVKGLRAKSFELRGPSILKQLLLFLTLVNMCFWFIYSIEVGPGIYYYTYTSERLLFGDAIWGFIYKICGPFSTTYYYHSSACIYEMWVTQARTTTHTDPD
ncbi:proton channel OtopLc-like [Anneissia japonica]|uniref:proton channel OtopLc-like n=1 Tax=Anneissia japonica TaxID=1529436 RepID=UPI001425B8CD|nr:proton channel OtopLc-like [Anneissia japonica]